MTRFPVIFSVNFFLERGAVAPTRTDGRTPREALRDRIWPIIEILREFNLATVELPIHIEMMSDDFDLWSDQITPLGFEFFKGPAERYVSKWDRAPKPNPKREKALREEFLKLKEEFERKLQ